ncbi:MAG: hypothetical protein R2712_07895 [Vicinamibacterales bacterium]
MMRTLLATMSAAALTAASAAALPQAPAPRAAAEPRNEGQDRQKAITMHGCLRTWDGKTVGSTLTPPPGSASAAGARYVMTSAQLGVAGTEAAAPTSGSARVAHDTYLLEARQSEVDLSRHLNHLVQVTGTVRAGEPGSTEPEAASPTPGTPQRTGERTAEMTAQVAMQTVHVAELKMLAPDCP